MPPSRPTLPLPTASAPDAAAGGGPALDPGALQQLIAVALPDKSRHKAPGWWDQTDFLITRGHVDADGDAFHDGLFITVWKRWEFWLALPGSAPPGAAHWTTRAWTRWRSHAGLTPQQGWLRQYRAWDAQAQPGPWQALDGQAPTAVHAALAQACTLVHDYWQATEAERRAGWPARARLQATLTAQAVAALIALPLFTTRYNDWRDPERAGCWLGDIWVSARQPAVRAGTLHPGALKLAWRNGLEAPGDAEDDAHACYQIELLAPDAPPAPGAVHPPGLALSYSQRQSERRVPLPADAALHVAHLLALFTQVREQLLAADARERACAWEAAPDAPLPTLACAPPYAPGTSDLEALGPGVLELSRQWQTAARAHATAVRAHWADGTPPPPHAFLPADPRERQAPAVLRLVRGLHAWGDADLAERVHRRFAFAPHAYAAHALRHAQPVHSVQWLPDGSLQAWVQGAHGLQCWQVDLQTWRATPAVAGPAPAAERCARLPGAIVCGDTLGDLQGSSEDGQPLWRHHVGGAVQCVAGATLAGTPVLAVATAAGYLALLRKGAGPDVHHCATSRLQEWRRIVFWDDAAEPLVW